jgi:hypothetical protein
MPFSKKVFHSVEGLARHYAAMVFETSIFIFVTGKDYKI